MTTQNLDTRRERTVNAVGYYPGVMAAVAVTIAFVGQGMIPTGLAAILAWSVITILVVPRRLEAGRALFVAIATALVIRDYSELQIDAQIWAVANLVVLMSVFVMIPLRNSRSFPFLHVWCLVESAYVFISFLIGKPAALVQNTFTPEVRSAGYRYLFIFNFALVCSALIAARLNSGSRSDQTIESNVEASKISVTRAYVLIVISVGLSGVIGLTGLSGRLGMIFEAIKLVGYGGWLILAMFWMRGRLSLFHKIAMTVMAGAWMLSHLGFGALYSTATPGFLVLALYLSEKKRVPWAAMLMVLVPIILLNTNKGEFRQSTWYVQSDQPSAALALDWIQLTASDPEATSDTRISTSAHRFANSDLLGYTATWVPDRYDYSGYEAYTLLPSLLVPRALLPDKPNFNFSNEFGRKYELISRSDYETTVNTPLHVEAFAAGGILPMLAVAAFSGVFLILTGRMLRTDRSASVITGCLLSYSVILTIESGILGFVLFVPFILFLLPIMNWAYQADWPVGAPKPARQK